MEQSPAARAVERWRGCEGGDYGGKCLWRKARQPWKQGNIAESCVGGGAIKKPLSFHARIQQLKDSEADPSNA